YFLRPHLTLSGEGQQWYTYTPAYRSVVAGGKLTVTDRPSQQMSLAVSITSEHNASSIAPAVLNDLTLRNNLIALGLDPRTLEQKGTLNALGVDFQRTTADSVLNAHHGYQIAFHAEEAGRLLPGTF